MLKSKKKALALAVLCAVSSMGFMSYACAEEPAEHDSTAQSVNTQADGSGEAVQTHQLAGITVEGDKDVLPGGYIAVKDRVGILGEIAAIDVPFTQKQYTEKTITDFYDPNQPLNGVLANNPSIRIGSPSPMYTDFSMRGVNMNAAHYYINGIPNMFNQTRSIPAYTLESVDIVSGPNTVLNGATFSNNGTNGTDAPAGLLNGKTKRATDEPITRYTQRFSGRSTWTEQIDVGRRFGEDGEWGIRVNAQHEEGGLSIEGADVKDKSIYINLDHKDEHSETNLFGGYFDWEVNGGQRWLNASKVDKSHLPSAPDGKTDLSFDRQTKQNHGYLFTLNHTQKFSDKWSAFFNGGYAKYNEHKWDPNSGSLTLENDGKLSGKFRDYVSESTSTYWQVGVSNEAKLNDYAKNNLSVAVDWYNYKSRSLNSGSKNGQATIVGDIWNGVTVVGDPIYAGSIKSAAYSKESAYAVTVADRVEFGKASIYGALQYKDTEVESSTGHSYSKDSLNPTFAIAYKPVDNLSMYVSHAESYTKPVEVGTSYINSGEIFEPIKNKQDEIGIKYENAGLLHSLAFFDLNQASYISEDAGNGDLYYSQEGENRYKGIEYSIVGKLAPKWNAMGGLMYLNAKRENLASGSEHLEGRYATGAPKWNAVLATEYEADENNSAIVRLNYVGESHVNDNGVKTPDYLTVDLGYKHKTELNGTPVTLSAMCYNAFGKDYWISRGTSVALGAPRTFMLSAQFDI
jgi:iron complex outermembrane receptor protein